MILVVQTNISGELSVWLLERSGTIVAQTSLPVAFHGSDQLLRLIDQTLKRKKIPLKKITKIGVVRGPGPFTAVRTGIIVANTLGWIMAIPVVGTTSQKKLSNAQIGTFLRQTKKTFVPVRPAYGRAPNITKPKRR